MKKITQFVLQTEAAAQVTLRLPYDLRKRSRFKAESTEGESLGVMLPRGRVLRDGDRLRDDSGRLVAVQAAPEILSIAAAAAPYLLARAAYHLGNRHVPLQIGPGWLRYQHDHVLDAMVVGLGLRVTVESAPFEPEDGAYASGEGGRHDHTDARSAHHDHDH